MSVLSLRSCGAFVLLLGASLITTPNSLAGNANSSLGISATVPPSINIDTTPINNVNYDLSTGADAQTQLTITASPGSTVNILIDQGSNPDTGSTDTNPIRRMSDGQGNYLNYELTKDASHTQGWGNTTQTGVSLTGTGNAQSVSLYLRILPNQNARAGNYTDTLQITTLY